MIIAWRYGENGCHQQSSSMAIGMKGSAAKAAWQAYVKHQHRDALRAS